MATTDFSRPAMPLGDAGVSTALLEPVPAPSGGYRLAKRTLDLLIASLVLVLAVPFLMVVVALIRLTSHGPALFRQQRVGEDGREFCCYKFRTMRTDADDVVHREYLRYLIENSAAVVAERLPVDPRITGVGRWLRKSSLDELPQLFNVLRGEMSVVGPRPPIPYEVEHYQEWHLGRLGARPGLTGLWQILGRGRVTFDEMCVLDLEYIHRQSLRMDLWILLRTPWALISRRGAG